MPKQTRGGKENAVFDADTNSIIKDESDTTKETKEKFLKRVAKEKKLREKTQVKVGRYIVVVGSKVLEKFRNKSGSEYSRYWFNAKRHPVALAKIKANGGHVVKDDDGKDVLIPLKLVDGKGFKKKG